MKAIMGKSGGGRAKGTTNKESTEKPKLPRALDEAEQALKELRKDPESKEAADRLERAVQLLKGQAKPNEPKDPAKP